MLERTPADLASEVGAPRELHHDVIIRETIAFLRASWRIIAACAFASLTVGVAYVMVAPRLYTADAVVLIDPRVPVHSIGTSPESALTLDTPQLESQLVVLRSQRLRNIIARHHRIQDDATLSFRINEWLLTRWLRLLTSGAGGKAPEAARLGIAKWQLLEGLEVRRIGLSHAIEITFRSISPTQAALYANAFADAYVEDQIETRKAAITEATRWLEDRIEDLRSRMNAAARQVQEFRARRDYRIPGRQQGAGADVPTAKPKGAAGKEPTLEELETRALAFRTIYESYLRAYAQSDQRQSHPAVAARVINRAEIGVKSHPRSGRALILALVFGCVVGIGVAFLKRAMGFSGRDMRGDA